MGYGVAQSGTWLKWLSSSSSRWGTVEINEGGGWLLLLLHLPNLVQFPVLASSYLESYRERDLGNCTPQLSQIDTVQILSFIQRDKELPIKFLQWGQPDAITPDLAVSWLSNSLTLQLLLSGQFFSPLSRFPALQLSPLTPNSPWSFSQICRLSLVTISRTNSNFILLFKIFSYLVMPGLHCDTRGLRSCFSCSMQTLLVWVCKITFFFLLIAACGIFSCGMWTLSCGMWDLVPWPGIEPRLPALGARSLSDCIPPGKSPSSNFRKRRLRIFSLTLGDTTQS